MSHEKPKYQILKKDYIDFMHPIRKSVKPVRLYRILALRDFRNPYFGNVKEGQIGGYIQSEDNLSHDGNCWVGHTAKVFDMATVQDNSIVQDDAAVFESAQIKTDTVIRGLARVRGSAILDSCVVGDKADILGNPNMYKVIMNNGSRIYEDATVAHTTLYDGAMIHGQSKVYKSVLKDVSEIRGDAVVHQSKFTGRTIIESGEHVSATHHADIDLTITSGQGTIQ